MSASVKIAFITTVLNEAETVLELLQSLNTQTLLPNEVVVVDGGSKDQTVTKILDFKKSSKNKLNIKLIKTKGNRSIGRNTAIKNSTSDIILISDAGCVLNKNWVKEISKPLESSEVDVVAGNYRGNAKTNFQKALVPYVLVMKPNPQNFLPATRSMAIRRHIWKEIGGFNQKLSNNEDYAFAKKIKQKGYSIYFNEKAIVLWTPRNSLVDAYNMFYRFALGDIESGIVRPKVILIIIRYVIAAFLCLISLAGKPQIGYLITLLVLAYFFWSVLKNYKYVQSKTALVYLPLFQITSDLAVLTGTTRGIFQKI